MPAERWPAGGLNFKAIVVSEKETRECNDPIRWHLKTTTMMVMMMLLLLLLLLLLVPTGGLLARQIQPATSDVITV